MDTSIPAKKIKLELFSDTDYVKLGLNTDPAA